MVVMINNHRLGVIPAEVCFYVASFMIIRNEVKGYKQIWYHVLIHHLLHHQFKYDNVQWLKFGPSHILSETQIRRWPRSATSTDWFRQSLVVVLIETSARDDAAEQWTSLRPELPELLSGGYILQSTGEVFAYLTSLTAWVPTGCSKSPEDQNHCNYFNCLDCYMNFYAGRLSHYYILHRGKVCKLKHSFTNFVTTNHEGFERSFAAGAT